MGLVSLYVNGTERACRTKIFTGSATDATLFIHDREPRRIRDSGHGRHHLNSTRRTMAGTVSAFHSVCIHYTILIYEHGMTNLYGRFFSHRQGAYGTVRTNLGTSYLHIPDGNTRVRKTFQAASTFLSKKKDARHHWGKPIHTTDRPCNAKQNCVLLALPPVLSAPYAPESFSPLSRPIRRLPSFPVPSSRNRPPTMKPRPESCDGHYPVPPFPEPFGLQPTDGHNVWLL